MSTHMGCILPAVGSTWPSSTSTHWKRLTRLNCVCDAVRAGWGGNWCFLSTLKGVKIRNDLFLNGAVFFLHMNISAAYEVVWGAGHADVVGPL